MVEDPGRRFAVWSEEKAAACDTTPAAIRESTAPRPRSAKGEESWSGQKSFNGVAGERSGTVFVYSGDDGAVLHRLYPLDVGSFASFGYAVAAAGDTNGDGVPDILVGAPFDNATSYYAGSAFVFSGADGSVLHHKVGQYGDRLGISVAGVGDMNGDGRDDFAVGVPDSGGGVVRVYSGLSGGVLHSISSPSSSPNYTFGHAVAGVGDVSADGVPDVLVGSPSKHSHNQYPGRADLHSGQNGALVHTWFGDNLEDAYGWSVGGGDDVNQDGVPDLIVGAPEDDNNGLQCGSARVLSGKDYATLWTFFGDSENDAAGYAVSTAGDVDNDGCFDVIVGAPGVDVDDDGRSDLIVGVPHADANGADSGEAVVFSGRTGVAMFVTRGDSEFDEMGFAVSAAGDLNGDGSGDFTGGSPYDDNANQASGSARWFLGIDGPSVADPPGDPADSKEPGIGVLAGLLKGDTLGGEFGYAIAFAGDVDDDGYADIVVGARYALDASGTTTGSATVYSGRTRKVLIQVYGVSSGEQFGYAVCGAGDVNGDGHADFAVGAPRFDAVGATDRGRVVIYSGNHTGKILAELGEGATAYAQFGFSLANAGDVNSDGRDDLIVGAPYDQEQGYKSGRVWVYSGKKQTILHVFEGTSGDLVGWSVAGVGDTDLDGADDIAVGAPYDNGSGYEGRVKVYSGAAGNTLMTLVGSDSSSWLFGWSVAGAGDVNGDGHPDVIVGAPYDDAYYQEAGMAWIFSGNGGAPLGLLFGEALKDGFGWSVAGAGDVDGDGRADVLVGAPMHDNNGDSSGGAWLYSGRDLTVLFKLDGAAEGDHFGWSVAAGSDMNGDGVPDLAVASPVENLTGVDAGAVRLYSGKTGTVGGPFNPGDILVGEIDSFVDRDQVDFIGLKGMTVNLKVSVLEGTLKPRITLLGPDGEIVDKWKLKGGFNEQKIKIKLKESGSYRLEISGDGATLGSYVVFTGRKLPKKAKESEVKKKGTFVGVDLLALPGATLDATITPLTGYAGAPLVSLVAEDGTPIASAPYSTSSDGVVTLTGVPITLIGWTTVVVEGADAPNAKVKIHLTPHQPAAGSGGVLVD